MKKLLFFAACALALASCGNTEKKADAPAPAAQESVADVYASFAEVTKDAAADAAKLTNVSDMRDFFDTYMENYSKLPEGTPEQKAAVEKTTKDVMDAIVKKCKEMRFPDFKADTPEALKKLLKDAAEGKIAPK